MWYYGSCVVFLMGPACYMLPRPKHTDLEGILIFSEVPALLRISLAIFGKYMSDVSLYRYTAAISLFRDRQKILKPGALRWLKVVMATVHWSSLQSVGLSVLPTEYLSCWKMSFKSIQGASYPSHNFVSKRRLGLQTFPFFMNLVSNGEVDVYLSFPSL